MNQQELLIIYKRNLYARKYFNEPIHMDLASSNFSDPDAWIRMESFVVDWEIQEADEPLPDIEATVDLWTEARTGQAEKRPIGQEVKARKRNIIAVVTKGADVQK